MPDKLTTARGPTKEQVHANAVELVRSCLARFGQPFDEAMVQRQASKIVKDTWPMIKGAWKQ
jgi:hypothetical protein